MKGQEVAEFIHDKDSKTLPNESFLGRNVIRNSPAKVGGKIEKVMHEYKAGKLHSGSKSGRLVKSRKQAVAIAMSEAGKSKKRA